MSHEKDEEAVEDRSRTRRVEESERRMQSVAISCNQLQSEAISGTPVLVASKKASGAWSNAAAIRRWSSRDARREQSVRRTVWIAESACER